MRQRVMEQGASSKAPKGHHLTNQVWATVHHAIIHTSSIVQAGKPVVMMINSQSNVGSVVMEFGNKGAYNELTATAWLLSNGYNVFRNVSAHGSVDLVAMKNSEVTLFDVKAASLYKGKLMPTYLTKEQIALGVQAIAVWPDGTCTVNTAMCPAEPFQSICMRCEKPFKTKRARKFCTPKCSSGHHNAKTRAKRATNGP